MNELQAWLEDYTLGEFGRRMCLEGAGLVIKRIHVLVEGQTEETFSNGILAAHLARYDIYPHTTRVTTRRRGGQRIYSGGVTQYDKIRKDLHNLCRDSDVVAITAMYISTVTLRVRLDALHCPEGDCYSQVHYLRRADGYGHSGSSADPQSSLARI